MPLRTTRHNHILHVILNLARSAGYTAETQQRFDHDDIAPELRSLVVDAVLIPSDARAEAIIIDVGITHPCSSSHVSASSSSSLHAANMMAKLKTKKQQPLALATAHTFIPCIIETYGGMCSAFRQLITRLISHAAEHQHLSLTQAKELTVHTFASIAVALHNGNGKLARRMYQVTLKDTSSRTYTHHAPVDTTCERT